MYILFSQPSLHRGVNSGYPHLSDVHGVLHLTSMQRNYANVVCGLANAWEKPSNNAWFITYSFQGHG